MCRRDLTLLVHVRHGVLQLVVTGLLLEFTRLPRLCRFRHYGTGENGLFLWLQSAVGRLGFRVMDVNWVDEVWWERQVWLV